MVPSLQLTAVALSLISISLSIYLLYLFLKIKYKLDIILFISKSNYYQKIIKKLKEKPRVRYIVFEIISNCDVKEKELRRELRKALLETIGFSGLARSGATLVYYDSNRRVGIARTRESFKNSIIGVLGLIRKINDCEVLIVPLRTTGTIKSAKKYINKMKQ